MFFDLSIEQMLSFAVDKMALSNAAFTNHQKAFNASRMAATVNNKDSHLTAAKEHGDALRSYQAAMEKARSKELKAVYQGHITMHLKHLNNHNDLANKLGKQ